MSNQADLSANASTSLDAAYSADRVNAGLDQMIEDMQAVETEQSSATSLAIRDIESRIIHIGPETPVEIIADVRNRVKFIGAEARRVKGILDAVLVGRVEETGQDIVLSPDLRLYVGTPPKYKIKNIVKLIEAVLEACGGDLDAVGECFASDPFKTSQLRSRFEEIGRPELFDELIETVREPELKEGKSVKTLREDNGFRRGGAKKAKVLS